MKIVIASFLIFYVTGVFGQTTHSSLVHDPFVKPLLPEIEDEPEVTALAAASITSVPTLRGILHSPRETLVNIEGKLLAVGGRYDRFVIVAVGERNAVLKDGEERHIISMDDPREGKDAPANYR